MSDESKNRTRKHSGERHQGEARSAPYPVGRLGAEVELVDLARQIAEADAVLNVSATSGLRAIAEQIRHLREQARSILEETQRNQLLHRARCNFQRKPGRIYHLYLDAACKPYFSMLSPQDWHGRPPHEFQGSYRLENDMSWTAVEDIAERDADNQAALKLLSDPRG